MEQDTRSGPQMIQEFTDALTDWRGDIVKEVRALVLETFPEITELWKWETPVWAHKGNVLAVGVFKDHVKINFFKGAALTEHQNLFNSGLEAKHTRTIDFFKNDKLNLEALGQLVKAAVDLNRNP